MMRYRLNIIGILFLLMSLTACTERSATCQPGLRDLLVSPSEFPEGWDRTPSISKDDTDGAIAECTAEYLVDGAVAHEKIYEFSDTASAGERYGYFREVLFQINNYDTPWESFTISSSVLHADDSYVGCSNQGGTSMCRLIAQYGRFNVFFNTHMGHGIMTNDDFVKLLIAIDRKMQKSGS